jgi:hypothetical protein
MNVPGGWLHHGVKWPATISEVEAAGYRHTGAFKECHCGGTFLWFITPALKWIPLSAMKDSRLIPHHAICERVKEFRAANKKHELRARGEKPAQLAMGFERKT